ncbi:MAG: DUF2949 domain-containing protein [Synechococcales cyanobacterium C42_A2020_086]|nr:DUF2949 domain-containing protein [Synechococcales cyanobacterium M58_A2018_015]MBF2072613.1 DUF2949 domain-containing protein [Synechococcales cyanobacterium C42_A2020_086]
MQAPLQQRLIHYLQTELAIPDSAIDIGLRQQDDSSTLPPSLLPVVLWQYGLITIEQLDQTFDWLESAA